jgi:hypothetical protein
MPNDIATKAKVVIYRLLGWFLLIGLGIPGIVGLFTDDIFYGVLFTFLGLLGIPLIRYKTKKKRNTIPAPIKNHWEERDTENDDEVDSPFSTKSIPVEHPTQIINRESIQAMVRAAQDIRREIQEDKGTVEIPRKQKDPYAPLLQLCLEIGNKTENNYIPFDSPISVEIKYCDRDGEITNREIDILYIAESDYDDGYYIKAYCHLRNENRTFNIERIQRTLVDGNNVDIIQHIVDTYRDTDKYKKTILEIKTRELLNSRDTIGYAAKILTYISRIDGIFTRKEKTIIAHFIKELDNNKHDIEIEDYILGLVELNPSTPEYKNIVKTTDISEQLIEKAKEITGKDPLRKGAFEILFRQYEKVTTKAKGASVEELAREALE